MIRTAFIALLAFPRLALAYNLETDASGSSIHWASSDASFLLDPTSRDVASADVIAAAQRAASHWEAVASVAIHLATESAHGAPGYDASNPSQNHSEIFFIDDTWDYDESVVAETLVTSDATTHQILDADVMINGAQHRFAILPDGSQPGTGMDDDLESALTHELGHALGLAHNNDLATATMYPSATVGEVSERNLSSDDIAGIRSIYDAGHESAPATGCSSASGIGLAPLFVLALLGLARKVRGGSRWATAAAVAAGVTVASVAAPARADEPAVEVSVKGVVREARAEWRGGLIVSHLTVDVQECRQGDCGAVLELEMLGGQLDGIEQHLSGAAVPHAGDAVEMELSHNRHGVLRPVGHVQVRSPRQ